MRALEIVVVSSALELSELLLQLAASSETTISRQKTIRLRQNGRLTGLMLVVLVADRRSVWNNGKGSGAGWDRPL